MLKFFQDLDKVTFVSENIQTEWSETQKLKDRISCPSLVDKKKTGKYPLINAPP